MQDSHHAVILVIGQMAMERDIAGEIGRKAHPDCDPAGHQSAVEPRMGVRHIDGVEQRRLVDRGAVHAQHAEMHLVQMKGMQLVGPVLDRPLLQRIGLDVDRRRCAHVMRLEDGARLAFGDVIIGLVGAAAGTERSTARRRSGTMSPAQPVSTAWVTRKALRPAGGAVTRNSMRPAGGTSSDAAVGTGGRLRPASSVRGAPSRATISTGSA
jgi:hypothetical protein